MTRTVTPRDVSVFRIFGHPVDHRDGAGHLGPALEAELRARVHDGLPRHRDRAFVRGTSGADANTEQSGEDFVWSVTTGEARRAP